MSSPSISHPNADEYFEYYGKYIELVRGDNVLAALLHQTEEVTGFLSSISETRSLTRYSAGKWSIKEVLAHVCDTERIFSYRALRIARNDHGPLRDFDQDDFVRSTNFDAIPWDALVDEYAAVREATLALFGNLPAEAWQRRGIASDHEISVRAVAYVIAGHELHHMDILRTRYLS